MSATLADRAFELQLARQWGIVVGMDEVGRGALAGPVCVGAVAVNADLPDAPAGIADSKLLSAAKRESLHGPVQQWALASAVGSASAAEIDEHGLTAALRMAGVRALDQVAWQLRAAGAPKPGVVLLDGSHDWLTPPQPSLWEETQPAAVGMPVITRVKADRDCVAVAAASVLAKVQRDTFMEQLEDPGYDWCHNKGYGAARHLQGLALLGPSDWHRQTWRLPGVAASKESASGGD